MLQSKTSEQVYAQWQRLYETIMRLGYCRAKVAHPETGGHPLYIHNWGKPEARLAVARAEERVATARRIYQRLYDLTAHLEHLTDAGNYSWCRHCQKRGN